jgi:uncharacterized protein (DUF2062 family)
VRLRQRTFKRGVSRLLLRLSRLIHLGESPERTAFAFAVGVFIAFTPTFGFHYITALLIFWLLRLNLPALLMGTTVNNPLTIAPIYSFGLWIGLLLVGGKGPRMPIDWELSWSLLAQLRPLLIPFFVGTLLTGSVAAAVSYWLVSRWLHFRVARRLRQAEHRAMKRSASSAERLKGPAGRVQPPLT